MVVEVGGGAGGVSNTVSRKGLFAWLVNRESEAGPNRAAEC